MVCATLAVLLEFLEEDAGPESAHALSHLIFCHPKGQV